MVQPEIDLRHDEVGFLTRCVEVVCLAVAVGLISYHMLNFSRTPGFFDWWTPAVLLASILFADFSCGVIHWTADTWGSATMPVVGRRFLRPFRVHHINPDDFLRRRFIDTNGDVALMAIPVLLVVFLVPSNDDLGRILSFFLVGAATSALPTNQVHQWAHMGTPPSWVRWLQRHGLILRPEQHQIHHTSPYATNYCITTGWCNPILTTLNFFPAAERFIAHATGLKPRGEQLDNGALKESAHSRQSV